MAETSKYDFFMNELTSLEKQIYSFIQSNFELFEENKELKRKVKQAEKENEVLKLQLTEFEERLSRRSENIGLLSNGSIDQEEREHIRSKIDDLINKIDFHLRS